MPANAQAALEPVSTKATPVEMLVVGCNLATADGFANALRNQGQAAHVRIASSVATLRQQLDEESSSLVVLNTDTLGDQLAQAVMAARDAVPTSSILLVSSAPERHTGFAVELGLQDNLHIENEAHLALAIRREHQAQMLRQQVQRLQRQLGEAEQRSNHLVRSSRDAIAYIHDGMYLDTNQAYLDMFGYEAFDEIDALPIMDMIDADSRVAFKAALRQVDEHGNHVEEFNCVTQEGQHFKARMEFSPASIDGEHCTQVMIRDQSHSLALQQRIDELTNKDLQTGFLNRQAFMEQLEVLYNDEHEAADDYALVQISISNHTTIREARGIECTDELLREVASVLSSTAVQTRSIARFGDHDFMLLCDPREPALEVAERCLHNLRGHAFHSVADSPVQPHYAIGVTRGDTGNGVTALELVNRSCRATAIARSEGENRVVFYNEQIPGGTGRMSDADAAMVRLIDEALANDGFRLKYQPIVSLQGDTRENYSVYLRLLDGSQELVPDVFLSPARDANRLAEIDRWVVRNGIRELARHRREGKKIVFFVSLSQASIEDDSILLWICDCLREFRAKGSWLVFQFRDAEARASLEPLNALIAGLRRVNCRIALSGYSHGSDKLLDHTTPDFVKLSPDYTRELAQDDARQRDLYDTNGNLRERGFKTIATGVEDAGSLAILWNVSVNYIQGYFLQEPSNTIVFDEDG
jgi:diguanylate cyclase (GGDEF)-like protein/PAS domain S-box-containing protein